MKGYTQEEKLVHEAAALILLQTCYLRCNPSSFHQRLILGGQNTVVNVRKMELSKADCLAGCSLASGVGIKAATAQIKALAPVEDHTPILDKDSKGSKVLMVEEVTSHVKERCYEACEKRCQGVEVHVDNPERPGRHTPPYTEHECIVNCATGCRAFSNFMNYAD